MFSLPPQLFTHSSLPARPVQFNLLFSSLLSLFLLLLFVQHNYHRHTEMARKIVAAMHIESESRELKERDLARVHKVHHECTHRQEEKEERTPAVGGSRESRGATL